MATETTTTEATWRDWIPALAKLDSAALIDLKQMTLPRLGRQTDGTYVALIDLPRHVRGLLKAIDFELFCRGGRWDDTFSEGAARAHHGDCVHDYWRQLCENERLEDTYTAWRAQWGATLCKKCGGVGGKDYPSSLYEQGGFEYCEACLAHVDASGEDDPICPQCGAHDLHAGAYDWQCSSCGYGGNLPDLGEDPACTCERIDRYRAGK